MQQYIELLGKTVCDKVTGAQGVVTSVCFDLYGCVQGLLRSPVDKDGKLPDAYWYDVKRLDVTDSTRVLPLPDFSGRDSDQRPHIEPGPESKPVPD